MKKLLPPLLLLLLLLSPHLAFAAGAYLVDDGGIVDQKTVQIENWYSHSTTGEDIFVSNPTYQLFPNFEFAVQETYSDTAKTKNTLWPQVKYLWHNSENLSSSFTVGVNYSSSNQKTYGDYAYSSNTLKLSKMLDLHLYLGWQNWRHAAFNNKSIDFLNYGIGAEFHFNKKLSFIPEIFQTNGTKNNNSSTKPATQFGLRYLASSNLILDTIYGHNINGNQQNWLTIGVTLLF
jgi:hypothetical protein